MRNQADTQYKELVETIMEEGVLDTNMKVRTKWADGTPAHTKSIISYRMEFDGTETPILTTKKVAWKSAIKELIWIWQMQSNKVQDLRDMGVKIWNEWEKPDGTIGKAYGFQLGKRNRKVKLDKNLTDMIHSGKLSIKKISIINKLFGYIKLNQVDYLLYQLTTNPASRRHLTMLWNPDDLDDMALTPCVYETQWYVRGNDLILEVRTRSNDVPLGLPFNIFQYHVVHQMIAQVTGYDVGAFIYNIGDAHIYTRHLDSLKEQVSREVYDAPELWINPDVDSFYDFTIDDFKLVEYKHGEKINMEVAI